MTNTAQDRVGALLVPPDFVYKYKPVDSPLHGGAVRIDWLAVDYFGLFWMVEVKRVAASARSFNLFANGTGVSPLQRQALDDVSESFNSVPLLAVWQTDLNILYIWGWRHIQWLLSERQKSNETKPELLPLETAKLILHYSGIKRWPPHNQNFRSLLTMGLYTPYDHHKNLKDRIQQTQIVLSNKSSDPDL